MGLFILFSNYLDGFKTYSDSFISVAYKNFYEESDYLDLLDNKDFTF